MSEDLIRRSDAIKALDANFTIKGKENMQTVLNYIDLVRTRIEGAPTIEPKRGKWVVNISNYKSVCSVCGANETDYIYGTEMWYGLGESKFCPNCGADMRKEGE